MKSEQRFYIEEGNGGVFEIPHAADDDFFFSLEQKLLIL